MNTVIYFRYWPTDIDLRSQSQCSNLLLSSMWSGSQSHTLIMKVIHEEFDLWWGHSLPILQGWLNDRHQTMMLVSMTHWSITNQAFHQLWLEIDTMQPPARPCDLFRYTARFNHVYPWWYTQKQIMKISDDNLAHFTIIQDPKYVRLWAYLAYNHHHCHQHRDCHCHCCCHHLCHLCHCYHYHHFSQDGGRGVHRGGCGGWSSSGCGIGGSHVGGNNGSDVGASICTSAAAGKTNNYYSPCWKLHSYNRQLGSVTWTCTI